MATNQKQASPPDKGRAKAIAANSRVMDRGIGALRKPGRKAAKRTNPK